MRHITHVLFIRLSSFCFSVSSHAGQHLRQRRLQQSHHTLSAPTRVPGAARTSLHVTLQPCVPLCQNLSDAHSAAAAHRYFSPRLPHVADQSASSHWQAHHSGAASFRSFSPRVPRFAANSSSLHAHDHLGREAGLHTRSVREFYSPRVPPGLNSSSVFLRK